MNQDKIIQELTKQKQSNSNIAAATLRLTYILGSASVIAAVMTAIAALQKNRDIDLLLGTISGVLFVTALHCAHICYDSNQTVKQLHKILNTTQKQR